MRRAITLVETLVAAALLTALAVAVLPIITTARAQLASSARKDGIPVLVVAADRIVDSPAEFGFNGDWVADLGVAPKALRVGEVEIDIWIVARSEDHAWVGFAAMGASVFRWVPIELERD